MKAGPLNQFPDDARLWVFASPAALSESQSTALLARVDSFLDQWHAHGAAVVGARDWRNEHFLLVASDERATGVSGCSIDSLYLTLKQAESELGVTLLDSSPVWYRDAAGEIANVPRTEFRRLAKEGAVDEDTIVFDNTVNTVGALLAGGWERPMRDSWHGKAFSALRPPPVEQAR
ncbi:MAG TPA: hypothetical protein VFI91_08430 [Longimicrobiaceae bacterium]|nr:hypothetical protein [Longimicrobiaceae bacterium]